MIVSFGDQQVRCRHTRHREFRCHLDNRQPTIIIRRERRTIRLIVQSSFLHLSHWLRWILTWQKGSRLEMTKMNNSFDYPFWFSRLFIVCQPSPPPIYILKDIFGRFGHLIDVYMLGGRSCGYAKYADKESADRALMVLRRSM